MEQPSNPSDDEGFRTICQRLAQNVYLSGFAFLVAVSNCVGKVSGLLTFLELCCTSSGWDGHEVTTTAKLEIDSL